MNNRKVSRILTVVAGLLVLSGCSSVEPWVKPYERDRLADPIMFLDMHPVSSSYIYHVYEAREGARRRDVDRSSGCRRLADSVTAQPS